MFSCHLDLIFMQIQVVEFVGLEHPAPTTTWKAPFLSLFPITALIVSEQRKGSKEPSSSFLVVIAASYAEVVR